MFRRKKRQARASEKSKAINLYLMAAMPVVLSRIRVPAARAAIQVFILGMADMIRQVERLSIEEFAEIYGFVLDAHGLLPDRPVTEHIDVIGRAASNDSRIEQIMIDGAQSLRMYVTGQDPQAPMDLGRAVTFAESNAAIFEGAI